MFRQILPVLSRSVPRRQLLHRHAASDAVFYLQSGDALSDDYLHLSAVVPPATRQRREDLAGYHGAAFALRLLADGVGDNASDI